MRFIRFLALGVFLGAVLLSIMAARPKQKAKPTPDEVKYAQEQIEKLKEERQKLQAEHQQKEAARQEKLRELEQNERNLNEHENNLAHLQRNLQQLEIQRNWLRAELKRTEGNLDELGRTSHQRVVSLYKEGSKPVLAFLLESKDGTDFFDRLYYSKLMVNQDLTMLNLLRATEARLERLRGLYQDKTTAVEAASDKVRQERESLTVERDQLATQRKQIESDITNIEVREKQLDEDEQNFQDTIRQYGEQGMDRDLAFNGRFLSPLRGPLTVTSPFGMRRHPISRIRKMHEGVDLRAATRTPVYAAARGRVIKAAYFGGYGNVVILFHGTYRAHQYSTVYGHNQEYLVHEGDIVEAGEEIAISDNTGYSKGPHLHFEIRMDDETVNPMKFIHEEDELP